MKVKVNMKQKINAMLNAVLHIKHMILLKKYVLINVKMMNYTMDLSVKKIVMGIL